MTFWRWVVTTPYPYVALGIPTVVLALGYEWVNVLVGAILSFGVFLSAGWVAYRRSAANDSVQSLRGSRSRAARQWPALGTVVHRDYLLGVSAEGASRRGYVLVFVPEGDNAWAFTYVASTRSRNPQTAEFTSYEAMVADLKRHQFAHVPPSSYSRVLADALVVSLAKRGVTRESLASGSVVCGSANGLTISGPVAGNGPRYAEFDRRVPTPREAVQVTDSGFGLALRRIPRGHRDLEFLELFPDLRGLWILGPVNPARVSALTSLTHLSLIDTGSDEVDLSGLQSLVFFEGELKGRESILDVAGLRELYLGRVDDGQLTHVPVGLRRVSLHGAAGLRSLDCVREAAGLRELEVQGARHLDISAISSLTHLHTLSFSHVGRLSGVTSLVSLRGLREIRLQSVGSIDAPAALDLLRGVDVIVT